MKIQSVRWVATVAAGVAIGLVAAQNDFLTASKAATPGNATANLEQPLLLVPPSCCEKPSAKESLLEFALPKPQP